MSGVFAVQQVEDATDVEGPDVLGGYQGADEANGLHRQRALSPPILPQHIPDTPWRQVKPAAHCSTTWIFQRSCSG